MVRHYNALVFSTIVEKNDYSFKNPTFGKSNTDQSYYEPMASMVQNLSKSGSLSSTLHNDAEKSIAQIRAEANFLPQNLTHEETQAYITAQREQVSSAIKSVNEQIKDINFKVQQDLKEKISQKSLRED